MYALCDVNAMYASCEKVFDPSIRNKPVIVLTNNDGCICAACGIAKRMGIGKKFVPYFQVKDELAAAGAIIRSSNYELYADLSQRMMDTCARFAPHFHIYSIDECFLYYGVNYVPPEGWRAHATLMRRTVWKEVRLPIGVGIGRTPTLAKAANHASKRIEGYRGVAVIDNEKTRQHILKHMDVTDVWGIGRRLGKRLNDIGIESAWQLSKAKPGFMRKAFSVLVENTVHELNGTPKLNWDDVRAPKQQIFSTRSFGQRVTDKPELRQAIISHVTIAASKLRRQKSLVKTLQVFASNSPHDTDAFYRQSILHAFAAPTSDTSIIAKAASHVVDTIFRKDVRFYKCGVGLIELVDAKHYQQDMFNVLHDKKDLMHCIDSINYRYGRNTIHVAAQGVTQKFAMRREFLSPQYTTRLTDIPTIFCD
jgi:DNA polymerase V